MVEAPIARRRVLVDHDTAVVSGRRFASRYVTLPREPWNTESDPEEIQQKLRDEED
jgi:hypothetical protein